MRPHRHPAPQLVRSPAPRAWSLALVLGLMLSACEAEAPPPPATGQQAGTLSSDPGALVRMELNSTVGVLLDEIPAGPLREAAAQEALTRSLDAWKERAKRQVRLTYYRLVFRGLYYPSDWGNASKVRGPLPLPPEETWTIALHGKPQRVTTPQHDFVQIPYTFGSHILTTPQGPAEVEPALATIGGVWDEAFALPTDPDLLLERTGYACMDEDEYPPGSVFEENTWYFYDDYCTPKKQFDKGGCHLTQFPQESCTEALQKFTGIQKTFLHFERIAYDKALADSVRVGEITNPNGADLKVLTEGMAHEKKIAYRYFTPGACELEEGVIGKLGWRRLLMFSAIVRNDGTEMLHVGDLTDPASPWLTSNVFEFSACHGHYHFGHYGTFGYNGAPGSKRAFCLEDTNRFHNDEGTPLLALHQSCTYQGITRGWGDEYQFGLPGQWVDITDVGSTKPKALTFFSNPNAFLCEGKPVLDASGQPIFDATAFVDSQGQTLYRQRCDMPANWADNNLGSVEVATPPGQSFVTESCDRDQIGPKRNCGFRPQATLRSCQPGQTVTLTCKTKSAQVLRICERSAALGHGVACTLADASANVVVEPKGTTVSFPCPTVRDGAAGTGGYSVYEAPLLSSQAAQTVSCTGW